MREPKPKLIFDWRVPKATADRLAALEEVARLARRYLSSCLSRDQTALRAALKALEERKE